MKSFVKNALGAVVVIFAASQSLARTQLFSLSNIDVSQSIHKDMSLKSTAGDSVSFLSFTTIDKKSQVGIPGHSKADQSLCSIGFESGIFDRFMQIHHEIQSDIAEGKAIELSASDRSFYENIPDCGIFSPFIGVLSLYSTTEMMSRVPKIKEFYATAGQNTGYLKLSTGDKGFVFRIAGVLKNEMTLAELLKVRSIPGQSGQAYGLKVRYLNPGAAVVTTESCTYVETIERCGRYGHCETYTFSREGRRNVASSYKFALDAYDTAGTVVASFGFSVKNEVGLEQETSCR